MGWIREEERESGRISGCVSGESVRYVSDQFTLELNFGSCSLHSNW